MRRNCYSPTLALRRRTSLSRLDLVLPARQALIASDEPRAAREGEVGPDPRGENGEAVAAADEGEDVYREPGNPRGKAAHVGLEGPFNLGDGVHPANGGHVAFVKVAEA